MAPQSKGGQKTQKRNYSGWFLNTQKVHFMFFFVIKVPNLFCKTSNGALLAL